MTSRPIDYTGDLEVCVDCVMMIANAEGTEEHAARMEELWPSGPDGEGWHLALGAQDCEHCGDEARANDPDTEDCEGWFSWRVCDGCGSRLGGTRHHAVGWRYVPTTTGVTK